MDREKIAKAAELCLESSARADRPFVFIAAFIKALKDDPRWTNDEIIEVQTSVIRALLKRIEDSEA